jgi:PadR family transcriptional regulator
MRQKGRGHGGGRGKARRRVSGLLQPCLLIQLCNDDRHGYDLLQGLHEFLQDADHDPSIIYRMMRDMEENALVQSYEGTESRGPRRRMYTITSLGRQQLGEWIRELSQTKGEIENLLSNYAAL